MPAAAAIGEPEHLGRLAPRFLAQLRIVDRIQERVVAHHVGPRVEQHAVAVEPVAAGTADLLLIEERMKDVLRNSGTRATLGTDPVLRAGAVSSGVWPAAGTGGTGG